MSNMNDFVIENGVLKKYVGLGGDVVIPDVIFCISNGAFENCRSLTNVTIPDSVSSIGSGAFKGCSSLLSIWIPSNLRSINSFLFSGCSSLTRISLPKGVTSIDMYAFHGCSSLKSITIPDSVTSIGDEAFRGCSALECVSIPKGILLIPRETFHGCRSLTQVSIPDGVTTIDSSAFSGCDSLKSVSIPESVTQIGDEAFRGCRNLKTVVLPASVNHIGFGAFYASGVEHFEVNSASKRFQSVNGILLSKNGKKMIVYPPKSNLNDNPIPDTVEQIGSGAFDGELDEWITIPKTVQKMANKSFFNSFSTKVFIYNADFARSVPRPFYLGDINNASPKDRNQLAHNFLYALANDRSEFQPFADTYAAYIRKNVKTYIKRAYQDDTVFHFFLQNKLIPKDMTESVKHTLEMNNRQDLKEALLEYQETGCVQDELVAQSTENDLKPDCGKHPKQSIHDTEDQKEMIRMDKKTARSKFTLSKHHDTYEIKGYSGVTFREGRVFKGSGYEYFFVDTRIPREITIPDEIDGMPVVKVAVKCIPEDAVVFCNGQLYAKLPRLTKANTARVYLEEPSRFSSDEAEQIEAFIKKYSDDTALAMCGSGSVDAYVRLEG